MRLLLGAAGLALAASLFLPWFLSPLGPRTSGWEHWAWADVVLVALAAALVAVAIRPPPAPVRIALAVLCGLGIAVVLGHGFEPHETPGGFTDVSAGPYVALAALAVGAIAAVSAWPARAGHVLLVVAAAGLLASLTSAWSDVVVTSGAVETINVVSRHGFERWQVLDAALLALAAGLVVVATGRAPRGARLLFAAAALAAATCIVVADGAYFWFGDGGAAEGASPGALLALLSLVAAIAGLALGRNTLS